MAISRPSASAPVQKKVESEAVVRRIFGWDKVESKIPAKQAVRFICRPTTNVGDPQYRTALIPLSSLQNPDPARYDTMDRLCGYWARQMEAAFALGKLDPSKDAAWELFKTEVVELPSFLSSPMKS
jgi:hypothetical protein